MKIKNNQEKLDVYLDKLKIATKELEIEQEKLEILLIPKSIKEKERNLRLMFDIIHKFQTLMEHTTTICKNSINIHNLPEIQYPETKGQNKIHTLNQHNWTLITDIRAIHDSLIESIKIIAEKVKV